MKTWDATTGAPLRRWQGHTGPVGCVAFSPDGRRLATGGTGGRVTLWDVAAGQDVLTLTCGDGSAVLDRPSGIAFRPDGKALAVASAGLVYAWEVEADGISP
jgi:WD40 repeat protein